MKNTILNLFVLLALFATVFSSCSDDDDDNKPSTGTEAKTPSTGTEAKLTGVVYALEQYAKSCDDKKVDLTFVDNPTSKTGTKARLYFIISDGATITKPAMGVTKTSDDKLTRADKDYKPVKTGDATKAAFADAPDKLSGTNVWEMILPREAKSIDVEIKSEDGNTTKPYSINVNTGVLSVVALKDFETKYDADEDIELSSTEFVSSDADVKNLGSVTFYLHDGANLATDTKWTINPALPPSSKESKLELGVTENITEGLYTLVIADYTLAEDTEYTVTGTSGCKSATRKFKLKASAAKAAEAS